MTANARKWKFVRIAGVIISPVAFVYCVFWFYYYAWQSIAPPGNLHPGLMKLAAVQYLAGALGSFCFTGIFVVWRKPGLKHWRDVLSSILVLGLAVAAGFPAYWHFQEVEKCLDSGGPWNSETEQCEHKHGDEQMDILTD